MKSSHSLFGTTSMAAASAVRVGIQIAILPIIGRLLGPQAFGQIALVSPFIFFAMMLAESGLSACIVRANKVTEELKGTVFSFSAAMSLLTIAIFAATAWPVGKILHEPAFPKLLLGMSAILLIASFNIVPSALLLRAKQYNWVALSDLVSTFGGVVAVAVGIVLGWGVWSIVAQQVVFWVCKTGVVIAATGYRPSFAFHKKLFKENIYFGSNLTGSSILSFISRNIDNILIGAFMGAEALGHYALAFQIVGLPQMVISGSVYSLLFSSTSEAVREGRFSPALYLKVMRGLLLVASPVIIGLAVTAPLSVPCMLGEQWLPMVPLIMWLAPLGLLQAMGAANSGMLIGLGKADVLFRLSLISAGTTILAIAIGAYIGSPQAVAMAVSLAALCNSWRVFFSITRFCNVRFRRILQVSFIPVFTAALMGISVFAIQMLLPSQLALFTRLVISIAAGILIYPLILFGLFRDRLTADIETIKTAFLVQRRHNRKYP
ncbi:MAG: lipopolysaccharide biosynthesis protein [Bdellovibrionales bacterium]